MSAINPMDPSTHHLTTSMSPAQLAMVAPEHHPQSSYAMPSQQSYHPVTPYMPAYSHPQPMPISPTNSRKRRLSDDAGPSSMPLMSAASVNDTLYSKSQEQDLMRHFELDPSLPQQHPDADHIPQPPPSKKSRVNTPWTPAEEQRLKVLRDQGQSWSEIAKSFPNRTEGSVKKHWYKDMHYAEFAQNESAALLHAIREYEQSKWKVIGQKVGKPAKACEQYAREHFSNAEIQGKVKPLIPSKDSGDGKEGL